MTNNNMYLANRIPGKPLVVMFSRIILCVLCIYAIPAEAANNAAAQNNSGEFRPKSERIQIAPSTADGGQALPERIIDIEAVYADPGMGNLPDGKPVTKGRPQSIVPAAVSESTTPAADRVRKRAKPDPNYAGTPVGNAAVAKRRVFEEKKPATVKRDETTRARHVKSIVEHGDSPELQAHNEKRRKIKEHFKTSLESREARKSLSRRKQSVDDADSK